MSAPADTIGFDDFMKVDVRVGRERGGVDTADEARSDEGDALHGGLQGLRSSQALSGQN